ncbi:tetratricopeptide repeat protein [bacterium]|nr:tetratricopeptide repeat protein [bacterium]
MHRWGGALLAGVMWFSGCLSARAFETPGLDEAAARYSQGAIAKVREGLGDRATAYQRAELLAAEALVLSTDARQDEAVQLARRAVAALLDAIRAREDLVASHFLLFKLYGQLSAADWTFALKTRDPLQYLREHAPDDRRTAIAESLNSLFTPRLFGGDPQAAVRRLEGLHAKAYDPETANLLAVAYEQTGQLAKARAVADGILQRNPRDRSAQALRDRLAKREAG